MSEEKFAEFLQRESQSYNAPNATPREEMWQVVAAARAKRAGSPTGPALVASPKRSITRWAPWIGMAATLLLGVGIGRYVTGRKITELTQTPIASNAITVDPSNQPAAGNTGVTGGAEVPVSTEPTTSRIELVPGTTPGARRIGTVATNGTPIVDPAPALTTASREHMQRAEALISVVAALPADAAMDSLTGRWARDMLTNTRLLIDSPAGEDPVRRQLFEDLETVLVLLIQRSGVAVDDRALVDRSLQRTQLLTRLRTSAAGI